MMTILIFMDQILHLIKKAVYTSLDETNTAFLHTSDQKYTAQKTGGYTSNFLDKGCILHFQIK
jgi:hypothetical protein